MKQRILVVDDDPTLAAVASEILELQGYEVRIQSSPFGTSAAVGEFRPALVLLDVNMPALRGDRLVPLLRAAKNGTDARIVLFSSNDEESLRRAVATTGADGFLRKGDIADLGRRVARFL